ECRVVQLRQGAGQGAQQATAHRGLSVARLRVGMLGGRNRPGVPSPMTAHPQTKPRFDILGIGNAIVDVVAAVEEHFLSKHDMRKGSMALIDDATAEALYGVMPPAQESSGGSAANTCAVAAALGAKVAYLGKVADDTLGTVFAHDISAAGVHFPSTRLTGGAPTARCLILVTPDGERTMNTFLGACVTLGEADVDAALV